MRRFFFFSLALLLILFVCLFPKTSNGQNQNITGLVIDSATNKPLPGANVILQSNVLKGTIADADGKFTLQVLNEDYDEDSLIISFMGYQEKVISISSVSALKKIALKQKSHKLKAAVVTGRRIIAEEFTIKQMKQLDIYLNPISKADPLLAVNSMPASTTTDESANISLRGSSPAETGIFFNAVPVYDAVRFAQLNGIGTFSIFNTSIVERMHVFPSNPPLEYGNASSGLISIQSQDRVPENNQNNISLSLANFGGQTTRKISEKSAFTLFANYQPSAGLIGVNQQALDDLESFYSGDLGLHYLNNVGDSAKMKIFNYTNLEGYNYNFVHPSFQGVFDQDKKRNFTIANFLKKTQSGEFSTNTGVSFSKENYSYGNTDIKLTKQDYHLNVNYQHFYDKLSVKAGVSYDFRKQKISGSFPVYEYALGNEHPSVNYDETREVNLPEAFLYGKYQFNKSWIVGAGLRKNISINDEEDYLSGQWNVHYHFKKNHSLNFSMGRYHHYALPNAELKGKTLFQSDQVSIDYKLDLSDLKLTSALFSKESKFNDNHDEIWGAEFYTDLFLLNNKIQFQASYTFIQALREQEDITFPTNHDLNYFIRSSLKYKPRNNLEISFILLYREGVYYRPVTGRDYDSDLNLYKPEFAMRNNMQRYPDYFKFDLSLSKTWAISNKFGIVTFLNVSNLFNNENVRDKLYNRNYTDSYNQYYSKRTIYFGGMIYF